MDYNVLINYASTLLFIVAALVFVVNVIVEICKKAFPKLPTTILTLILAVVVTLVAFFAWASYINLTIVWYYIVAAFILGLFVAYAAMFGFDKLKEAFDKLKEYKKI